MELGEVPGEVAEELNPEGTATRSIRNLAGWPARIEEHRGAAPAEVTELAYDAGGRCSAPRIRAGR